MGYELLMRILFENVMLLESTVGCNVTDLEKSNLRKRFKDQNPTQFHILLSKIILCEKRYCDKVGL